MTLVRSLCMALLLFAAPSLAKSPSRQAAMDELLAADRAFSEQGGKAASPIAALNPMLDEDVVMPVPGKGQVIGHDAVVAALGESPSLRTGKVSWTPVRGGISADGTHGFTFGFLSLSGGDPAMRERKYLSYWIKRPNGWRVAAYRHQVREAAEVSSEMMPPSLPGFSAKARATSVAHQQSVAAAEKAFSDRAQLVGLKAAFYEFGREDSVNIYNGAGFTVGRDAISAGFPNDVPSNIHWSTERSLVASSGDLGVSIGTIWPNKPAKNAKPRGFPFFTIWRREGPNKPWRYIVE